MAISDIVVIAIILIGAFIGMYKGFFKSLASLLGVLVTLVGAYLLTTFTLDLITSIPGLHNALYGTGNSLAHQISNALPDAMKNMSLAEAQTETGREAISQALGGGLMSLLTPLILSLITKMGTAEALSSATMADCIGVISARCIAWVVLFIVYVIILRIVVALIRKLGDLMQRRAVSRSIDRVFGFLIGGIKGTTVAILIMFVLSLVSGFEFMSFYRNDMEKSVIAKPLSDITVKVIGGYINLDKISGGLIGGDKTTEEEESAAASASENVNKWIGLPKMQGIQRFDCETVFSF